MHTLSGKGKLRFHLAGHFVTSVRKWREQGGHIHTAHFHLSDIQNARCPEVDRNCSGAAAFVTIKADILEQGLIRQELQVGFYSCEFEPADAQGFSRERPESHG